jgi:hypothetical protein
LSLLCWRKGWSTRQKGRFYRAEITKFAKGDVFIMEERDIASLFVLRVKIIVIAFVTKSKVVTDFVLKIIIGNGNTGAALKKKYIIFEEWLAFLFGKEFDLLDDSIVQW